MKETLDFLILNKKIKMEIFEAQIISIIALGVGTIFVGILPAWFSRHGRQQWPLLLSSMLCFGGGVLLATSTVHILPELRTTMPEKYKDYSELIFCAGFFILYLIDEIVHYFYGESHEFNIHNVTKEHSSNNHHNHSNNGNLGYNSSERRHSSYTRFSYGTTERDPLLMGEKQAPYNPSFYRARSDSQLFEEGPPSQLCHGPHQEPCNTAPTAKNIGLLLALSVHSLLEGLIVGLEGLPSKILLLLGAIASHKLVIAFCLGVELTSNNISFCKHFISILIFALGSVAGIVVGMVISNIPSQVQQIAIPMLQGLAGGTLLYVTVSEVIPRERARWHQQHNRKGAGLWQFSSVSVGFLFMTLLSKYLDYDG